MRRSFIWVAATFIAAFAAGSAAPARAQGQRAGTVIVPPSNVVPPQDRGKRAHTNFLIFRPAKGGFVGASPSGETPSSLACVYQVGTNNIAGCPVRESGSTMNYEPPTGGSNIIAIVDAYDYPTAANDFQTFSQKFGLPYGNAACGGGPCFTKVWPGNSQPASNGSWAQEEALDIEWAHAMAPNAQIVLVEAASNSNADLMQAVGYANDFINAAGGKGEVSMSWGSSESSSEISYDSSFTQPGITYFASSGDSGGKVIWPSASPNVVSAGGTTVNRDSSGNFTSETTWSSAGGGPSSYEFRPSYQDPVQSLVGNNRGTPDISFDANPATGVSVYDSTRSQGLSGWLVFGGTSVASPSLAGIVNNAGAFDGGWDGGNNTSSVQNNLYSNYAAETSSGTNCSYSSSSSTPFYDITSGSKVGTYSASGCWDFASGIGTLRGLTGPTGSTAVPFSLSAPSTTLSVTQGSSVSSTITVNPSATFTGSVDLTPTAPSGSGLIVSVNPTSVPSGNSWTSTLTVDATNALAGTYTVTVAGAGSGGNFSSSTAVTVTVNAPPPASGGTFSVSASAQTPTSVSPGQSATYTVTVNSTGFSGSVTLSVSGLPKFAHGSFATNPVTVSGSGTSTTLTVKTNKNLASGSYSFTITGTSGSQGSSSPTVYLVVN